MTDIPKLKNAVTHLKTEKFSEAHPTLNLSDQNMRLNFKTKLAEYRSD